MNNQTEQHKIEEKIGASVLEQIKEDHIKPKPRWEFLAHDYFIWFIFATCLVLAILAKATAFFAAKNTYWSYFWGFSWSTKTFFLGLPLFWIAILLIFFVLAFYTLSQTKNGYRYNTVLMVIVLLVCSIICGLLVYSVGLGEKMESVVYHRFFLYQKINDQQSKRLTSQDGGRLTGMVVDIDGDYIRVKDFDGRTWEINTSSTGIISGERVVLIGEWSSDNNFHVDMIQPWFKSSGKVIDLCPVCH